MENLLFDYEFLTAKRVGNNGFKFQEVERLAKKLKKYNQDLAKNSEEDFLSFRKLPYDLSLINEVNKLANIFKKKFDNMVVVGIGGSDLGAKTINNALAGMYANQKNKKTKNLKIYFAGDTTDPAPLQDLINLMDLKKTIFYVVSNSGSTIETMSSFLYIRQQLIDELGIKKHKQNIIVTTNEDKSILLDIAHKESYAVFPHYPGGGRYSVLSVNGLLPAACAGFNIKKLLDGAKQIDQISKLNDYKKNSPFFYACINYLAYTKRNQNISVLMPYSYYLKDFGFWYRQLWAESIGNKYDLKKQKVNIGITPVAALGPSDQHSQLQLYNEGPYDKIITFIKVLNKKNKLKVPQYPDSEISYLSGHKFADILNKEHLATSVSLMKNKYPNCTLEIPQLNEYYLGQLFQFFMMSAVYTGYLLNVNVFDQPGVEQSKKYMYGLLGRKGFEKFKKELRGV